MEVSRPASRVRHYGVYMVFLFGYLVMSFLVLEQGRTIENQMTLIRSLFFDSAELTAMKLKQGARHNP